MEQGRWREEEAGHWVSKWDLNAIISQHLPFPVKHSHGCYANFSLENFQWSLPWLNYFMQQNIYLGWNFIKKLTRLNECFKNPSQLLDHYNFIRIVIMMVMLMIKHIIIFKCLRICERLVTAFPFWFII